MIEVENLSKTFAGVYALSGLSFSVKPGELVGFLGQNGAGKSTTMRILTGYLPPSSGRARVMGFDVETQRTQARATLGYLPESVPLYPELRVIEYLRFRARLKEVKPLEVEVERVIQKTALAAHKQQMISTLSKGFRQRVGLADALLHNPPILLLDEPTEGLDPAQIKAARSLIHELAKEHTVLLSSHILPEVERSCSRVILLHKGKLVADLLRNPSDDTWQHRGAPSEIKHTLALLFEAPPENLAKLLAALPGVEHVERPSNEVAHLTTHQPAKTKEALLALCVEKQLKLQEMRPKERRTLEELFLAHTTLREASGTTLREASGTTLREASGTTLREASGTTQEGA
jgi:ABC-2 type transport system ATP-binding protein